MTQTEVRDPFWCEAPPELDQYGSVQRGGMLKHQLEWWRLKNFVKLLVAGYGAGKTLTLCKRFTSLAIENAPAPVAIVSPTYPMARETVISTMIELLDGKATLCPLRWSELKQAPYQFKINYGGRKGKLLIYSGEKPERLKGPNLAAAGVDEPFIQEKAVFEQMIARVRHPDAKQLELDLTGTPEELNWGYELAEGELGKGYDVGLVRASTLDNPTLAGGFAQRLLEGYDEKAAQAFVHGRFVNLGSGLVYHAFDRERNVQELQVPGGARWFVGMDFNVNPMAFVVGWHYGGHVHIEHEYELPNSDTEEACATIRDDHPHVRDVYPDATGRNRATNAPGGVSDFTYIERAGLVWHARYDGNPPRRDRFNAVNGKLKSAGGAVTMSVHPRCTQLILYMGQLAYSKLRKKEQDAMTHLADAMSYPVAYLFPVREIRSPQGSFVGA